MSDDLIERLARAIRVALAANQGVEADVNSPMTPNEKRAYLPVARAALAEIEAAGYAVVPVEPTEAMVSAWSIAFPNDPKDNGTWSDDQCARADWSAMLSASRKRST